MKSRGRLKNAEFARNAPAVFFARALVPPVALAFGMTLACATATTTTLYTPITGIQIPAAAVVAGHGCGTRPDQVYKYAAVVAFATDGGGLVTAGVFDCFTDGIFSNLQPIDAGPFQVTIYAFSQRSLPSALACPPTATPCASDDAGAVQMYGASADWTAECTAVQIPGSTTVASCSPLEPSDAVEDAGDAAVDATLE
jgi:hypothetical protein